MEEGLKIFAIMIQESMVEAEVHYASSGSNEDFWKGQKISRKLTCNSNVSQAYLFSVLLFN